MKPATIYKGNLMYRGIKAILKMALSTGLIVGLVGCASRPHSNFESLSIGMEKDQVVERMGPPKFVRRVRGEDRWKYVYYHDGIRFEKYVHFDNGKAIYLGDLVPGKGNAAEEDELIAKENAEVQAEWEAQYQQRESRSSKEHFKQLDEDFLKFNHPKLKSSK